MLSKIGTGRGVHPHRVTPQQVLVQPAEPVGGDRADAAADWQVTAAWVGIVAALALVIAVLAKRMWAQRRAVASLTAALEVQKGELRRVRAEVEARKAGLAREGAEHGSREADLKRRNKALEQEIARISVRPAAKSKKELGDERLARQLRDVRREGVRFFTKKVMNKGEIGMFYAAKNVTRQPNPGEPYAYYVFPQVSLGEVLRTKAAQNWEATQAMRAVNSKRCDLLLADSQGNPVAVLEYQGKGHDADGTAERRDEIKRAAVEAAGMRFVEVADGASGVEMRRQIEAVLKAHLKNTATNT